MSSTADGTDVPQQNDQAEAATVTTESDVSSNAPKSSFAENVETTGPTEATLAAETTGVTGVTGVTELTGAAEATEAVKAAQPAEQAAPATGTAQPFASPQAPEQTVFSAPTAANERPNAQGNVSQTTDAERRWTRPKTGPIVWGVLVLAFCVFTMFQAIAPGVLDGTVFLIAAVISLGLLLLAISAAVIVRSARNQRR